jgi:hypothetical protein
VNFGHLFVVGFRPLGLFLLASRPPWMDRWMADCLLVMTFLFSAFIFQHTKLTRRTLRVLRATVPTDCQIEIVKEVGDSRDFYCGSLNLVSAKAGGLQSQGVKGGLRLSSAEVKL